MWGGLFILNGDTQMLDNNYCPYQVLCSASYSLKEFSVVLDYTASTKLAWVCLTCKRDSNILESGDRL